MTQKLQFFGVALALTFLAACGDAGERNAPPTDVGPVVRVTEVAPISGPSVIQASGIIGFKRETDLAFNAPGVIAAIDVDSGDRVRRGQRLASLRRTSGGSNVDEAALARANAERDLARTQELYDRGFVSEARLDDARLAVERARDSSALTAPADGVILRRFAELSQTVNAGTPVLAFGETGSGVIVRAPVSSAAAARVRTGDLATVRLSELGGQARQGRVTRVGAQGDQLTGAFEIEIDIRDREGLRSGMVATAEIAATAPATGDGALLAPTLSLLDARADQGVVFVVDAQNVARRRAVRTAGVTQDGVIIVEGLSPGERVVSAGAAYVRDGEPVRIAPES